LATETLFSDFADRFADQILVLKKPASSVTMRSHLKLLRLHFGDTPVATLDYPATQKVFSALSAGLRPKTVRNIWATMRDLLGQAKREGLIREIPQPVLPRVRKTDQPWFSLQQMNAVIAVSAPTYSTLYRLLAETGLRIGEALALEPAHIAASTLTIRQSLYQGKVQAPKTDASIRILDISRKLHDQLLELACSQHRFLFRNSSGSPLWPNDVLVSQLHPTLRSIALPACGFHAFRRGAATLWTTTLGMPEKIAAYRLGHAAPGLTLGLYAQAYAGIDKDWGEKIGEMLK